MKRFCADLHVHSVLSPCGDLDMSPTKIIGAAQKCGIDILAITDHNATHHARLMIELGKENGILVIPGAEVNTREEIHCLALFENISQADRFQEFLDDHLPRTRNDASLFGQQLLVDRNERIQHEVEPLLISSVKADIYQVCDMVHQLGGLFIPAHIDRPYNSVLSQLGFIPNDLYFDVLEVSARYTVSSFRLEHPELAAHCLINNSDAHTIASMGRAPTYYKLKEASFNELLKAFRKEEGRKAFES